MHIIYLIININGINALYDYTRLNVSNNEKKLLIKYFTEMYMGARIVNPECIYTKLEDATGDAGYNFVRLNEKTVNDYLDKDEYSKILMLIFHECTHTYQKYYIRSGEIVNYLLLIQTKEAIIRNRYSSYYDENYQMCSEESEARYMDYKELLEYLKILKLGLSAENTNYCNLMMKENYENIKDENRVLNGKKTNVGEIFDNIELTVNEYKRFPLLKIEYKIENGGVIKKSKEEIENDYNNYLASLKNEFDRQQICYLYSKIMDEKIKNNLN